jgi:GT2 family glycosyltransferase
MGGPITPSDAEPSLAAVIAAYNASGTIGAALDSVLAQTRPADEIVVCDDGSADGERLRDVVAARGARVRLIDVPHGGESRAKNAAVAATSCEVICLLDADDTWEPDRLSELATALRRRPDLSIVTTDAWHERDGRVVLRHYAVNEFPVHDQRSAILRANFVFGQPAVRRAAWDEVGGFREGLLVGADWDCWLRLLYAGHMVGLVDRPLLHYRLSPNSLSGNRARTLRARVNVLELAAREQQLSSTEAATLQTSLRRWRADAILAEAREALVQRHPGRRRRASAVVRSPGMTLRTRAAFLLAAAAPALARRRLIREVDARALGEPGSADTG